MAYCYNRGGIFISADDVLNVVKAAIEAHKDEEWMPDLIEELRCDIENITGKDIGENV